MSINIESKLPNSGTTIFTVMSGLANEYNAVNLGQGFPDFPMNQELQDLVTKSMKEGFNQYMPMQGSLSLREAIAEKSSILYNAKIDPANEVTITPGGTYAIYTAITTVIRPGDEVIVFEPAYDSYIPNIIVNQGIPIRIPLKYPDYSIDWDLVKERVTNKTRMIIINSPHNPTGSIINKSDIEELRSLTLNTNIVIVSDEVYEHIIFDGSDHESILKYPDLMERSFACFSFGKVFHCTGWKIGYCISSATLMTEFRKIHQFNCFSTNSTVQPALAEFISKKENYIGLAGFLEKKRDYFISLMKSTKFKLLDSKGSYFICADYSFISDERDLEFAKRLTMENGVATIPMSSFYQDGTDNKILRFCFAKSEETLEKAAAKLKSL